MSSYSGLTLVANPFSLLISIGGTEVTDSRRYIDLLFTSRARLQFKASAGMTMRIEYSTDNGGSWSTLIPENSFFGGNPFICDWVVIPEEAKYNDVLVRAIGIGVGLLQTINYAEMSFD